MSDYSELNFTADTINEVFANFEIPVIVSGGTRSPVIDRFKLNLMSPIKVKQIKSIEDELALSLGKTKVRISQEQDGIFVEVGRNNSSSTRLDEVVSKISTLPPFVAIAGLDNDAKVLCLRLTSSEIAHILIAGMTGSGKTALVRSLLVSLAYYNSPNDLQFVLIDAKGRGLAPIASLPHVSGEVTSDPIMASVRIKQVVEEMERRDRERISMPKIVLAIDELADLIMTFGDEIRNPLTRLCQRGREAGIHVIASTQKPTAQIIGGIMKSNFPVRLIGSTASKNEAQIATGIAGSGAETLTGKGDFMFVSGGETKRFNALWLDAEGFKKLEKGGKDGKRKKWW